MNPTKDPNKCPLCEGSITEVERDTSVVCKPCVKLIEESMANKTALEHLWDSICCFFDFSFIASIGSFVWFIQRVFSIGDYNPNGGYFYTKGYLKAPPKFPRK